MAACETRDWKKARLMVITAKQVQVALSLVSATEGAFDALDVGSPDNRSTTRVSSFLGHWAYGPEIEKLPLQGLSGCAGRGTQFVTQDLAQLFEDYECFADAIARCQGPHEKPIAAFPIRR